MINMDSSGSESESSAVVNDSFDSGERGEIGPRAVDDGCLGGGVLRRCASLSSNVILSRGVPYDVEDVILEDDVASENAREGCVDMAVVLSEISSNISKYCSMQTLMRMPSVISPLSDRVDEMLFEASEDVVRDILGIEQNWVSRIMLEPDTRFGAKHRARLVASIKFTVERMEISWRRSMRQRHNMSFCCSPTMQIETLT